MDTMLNKYHTHISSKHKLFSLNLKEVYRFVYKNTFISITNLFFFLI